MNRQEQFYEVKDLLLEEPETALKPPRLFQVVLMNDDFTPMEFVVAVLNKFFNMELAKATQIMWQVHTRGRGVCGIYTRDIAETKVSQVNQYSKEHAHPLLCVLEVA
jgi:ATP-dependent Clp protease adaptor protein ClpS